MKNNFSNEKPALLHTERLRSDRLAVPVQMVRAAAEKSYEKKNKSIFFQCVNNIANFLIGQKVINTLWILSVILLTVLFCEMCFGLWIAHLSPDRFQRLTSCLDAGIVPSWKERLLYHSACFIGIL